MKKIIFASLLCLIISGCSSSQKKGVDTVSKSSPEWKLDADQKNFLHNKKPKYKTLVVYFSKTGNTQKIAYKIAVMLKGDIDRIIDLKNRGFCLGGGAAMFGMTADIGDMKYNPADYDLVILGTPIWSWNMSPAMRAYIEKYKGKFKNLGFFVTAGGTAPGKIVKKMEKLTGKKGIAFTGFIEKEFKTPGVIQKRLNKFLLNFLK